MLFNMLFIYEAIKTNGVSGLAEPYPTHFMPYQIVIRRAYFATSSHTTSYALTFLITHSIYVIYSGPRGNPLCFKTVSCCEDSNIRD